MSSAAPTISAGLPAFDDAGPRLTVTTLLVVQQGREHWLDETFESLRAQLTRPTRIVVVDGTQDRMTRTWLQGHPDVRAQFPDISVVTVPTGVAFADVVDIAVDALPEPGEDSVVAKRLRPRGDRRQVRPTDKYEWLWLLHEDSAPSAGALAALMEVVGSSSRVGVVGCKVVRGDDPRRLINVGIDVTRTGRHVGSSMYGERDQGQYDTRRDVLAVSSAGMLVRRDVFTSLGGFDPAFDGDGDGLDLCWRAHLTGYRVVVVPQAAVRQNPDDTGRVRDADRPAPRSAATLRRHRQVALARCSVWAMPFVALWVLLTSLLGTVTMLVLKRPRRARAELAQAAAPFGLRRILGARYRFFGRASARRRHLATLFVPSGAALHYLLDSARSAVDISGATADRTGPHETGPVSEDAESLAVAHHGVLYRFFSSPGLWATIAAAVAAGWLWRSLLTGAALRGTGSGLVGDALRPFPVGSDAVWRSWTDHWVGAGLGHANSPQPYLAVLAGLAWLVDKIPGINQATAGGTAIAWLLALSIPASVAVAYVAGRVATPARWPRAAAALGWGSLATLSTAVAQGRLGPAVAHILLPAALAGVVRLAAKDTTATWGFATALCVAVLGAFAPGLLVVLSIMSLVVATFARGLAARLRGLLAAVLPWLLLWPWTASLLDDWRRLLGGPGTLTTAGSGAHPWQLALLHPGGAGSFPVLFTLPVLILGLLGLWRCRGRLGAILSATILVGLALGITATQLRLYGSPSGDLAPWPGIYLDLGGAALIGAALRGWAVPVPVIDRRSTAADRRRKGALVALGGAATVLATAMLAGTAWRADLGSLHPYRSNVPDVVTAALDGPRAVRALVLTAGRDGGVTYDLRGREFDGPATTVPHPRADHRLQNVVASMLGGGSPGEDVVGQLRSLAVGFVVVDGDGDRSPLLRAIQSTGALTPMTATGRSQVWRLSPVTTAGGSRSVAPSRLILVDADGPVLEVASTVQHGRTTVHIPPGSVDRTLVVSEASGWSAGTRVEMNGRPIRRVDGAWPTYAVGAQGGRLTIVPAPQVAGTHLAQGILWALAGFLSIPFGTRASRRRRED